MLYFHDNLSIRLEKNPPSLSGYKILLVFLAMLLFSWLVVYKLDNIIKPETGKVVIGENTLEDGSNDPNSLHAGLPVIAGTKYIGVIWIRGEKYKK